MRSNATEVAAASAERVAASRRLAAIVSAARILPVLRAKSQEQLESQTAMCLEAGMTVVELTTTSPGWQQVLTSLKAQPDSADRTIGVGTVTSPSLARSALKAGADFLVTPYWVDMLEVPEEIPIVRGAFSPSELADAAQNGQIAKLFPASALGPAYLRSVLEVLDGATVIPTGGIGVDTARSWLDAGAIAVGMGSKLFDEGLPGLRALRDRFRG
ncbi:MAG: 2-dehydro-3-deoxyphosphogluconate aldolase / (4S)-4-hydroxy-2-oxoglutarate aldolase [Frankiales bacterium]|jgi:2-dehydro-3-deoxyphosphogluconate aldolase/(4S)-4-hydroxy-2-oxoglutarate aldolase|nr:2-dehydro-3-deoxyphosphogluconate aldolase / (4S)-4-hydroxy-2-oxoglutarate aldolase [Frankiales bacterium]